MRQRQIGWSMAGVPSFFWEFYSLKRSLLLTDIMMMSGKRLHGTERAMKRIRCKKEVSLVKRNLGLAIAAIFAVGNAGCDDEFADCFRCGLSNPDSWQKVCE